MHALQSSHMFPSTLGLENGPFPVTCYLHGGKRAHEWVHLNPVLLSINQLRSPSEALLLVGFSAPQPLTHTNPCFPLASWLLLHALWWVNKNAPPLGSYIWMVVSSLMAGPMAWLTLIHSGATNRELQSFPRRFCSIQLHMWLVHFGVLWFGTQSWESNPWSLLGKWSMLHPRLFFSRRHIP